MASGKRKDHMCAALQLECPWVLIPCTSPTRSIFHPLHRTYRTAQHRPRYTGRPHVFASLAAAPVPTLQAGLRAQERVWGLRPSPWLAQGSASHRAAPGRRCSLQVGQFGEAVGCGPASAVLLRRRHVHALLIQHSCCWCGCRSSQTCLATAGMAPSAADRSACLPVSTAARPGFARRMVRWPSRSPGGRAQQGACLKPCGARRASRGEKEVWPQGRCGGSLCMRSICPASLHAAAPCLAHAATSPRACASWSATATSMGRQGRDQPLPQQQGRHRRRAMRVGPAPLGPQQLPPQQGSLLAAPAAAARFFRDHRLAPLSGAFA